MINLERLTLKCLLRRSVEKFPHRPALSRVDGPPMTYEEFDQKVQALSQFMHKQGIVAGDRVAILSENKPNWGVAYFAITTMGAVAVPILPDFHANEVHHIIRHADCKGLFVSERLYDKVDEGEFDVLQTIIFIDDFSLIP
ncbi:MAG: long-chain fatty acid--CoA ligase, partial [Calditrichaeota bacterium]|nr:long-chain fatty acid--CoA ligase [Calditrichota bacterium]